jgi:probable addiction module antidote protein
MTEITDFEVSDYLDTEEKIADYLSSIIEDKDWGLLMRAIGDVAKARGMTNISKETGLGRESLYKAFNSNTQPKFDTVVRVLDALNIDVKFSSRNQEVEDNKKPIRTSKRMAAKKKIAA